LRYEITVKDYRETTESLISREASRNIALTMELFESYLKDIFCSILCYDSSYLKILEIDTPFITPSFEEMRSLLQSTRINKSPFNKRALNNSNIRKFLNKEFLSLCEASTVQNQFNFNYSELTDALVALRHVITHNNFKITKRQQRFRISYLQFWISLEEGPDAYVLKTSIRQADYLIEKIQEYAFIIFKELSKNYNLEYLSASFSYMPQLINLKGNA
jgi:hypothetical protein